MAPTILGIHHVTAIAGEPAVNRDFYTRVLGLRLVKRTVNYDDPGTWHLYFGDRLGRPGTLLTFFPHARARPARPGSGEVALTRFAVPTGSLDHWRRRLDALGIAFEPTADADRPAITLRDPHDTRLALVEAADAPADAPTDVDPWVADDPNDDLPADAAILGFDSVQLAVRDPAPTVALLSDLFALREITAAGTGRRVFSADGQRPGQRVEVVPCDAPAARFGAGAVHHVAFRVADEADHDAMRRRLTEAGLAVSEVKDRQYFKSIYFREPGGVICEIATDGPGNTFDEPEQALGQSLMLPPWLEPQRPQLERALPPLTGAASP